MNNIDMIVLIVISVSLAFNLAYGFFKSLALQGGIVLGFFAGLRYYQEVFARLSPYLPLPELLVKSVAFVLVFSLLFAALYSSGLLLEKTIRSVRLKPLSRILAIGLGVLEGALIAGLILHLAVMYEGDRVRHQINDSKTGTYIVSKTKPFYDGLCEKSQLPGICKTL